jgi:thioredoxin
MSKLSSILVFVFAISIFSCSNTQGHQENNSTAKIQKTGDSGGNEQVNSEAKPEYLTYETFKEKVWDFETSPEEWNYKGDIPCVIDFYADWCKPCKMVAPIMDEMAKKYDGKVKIYKINTDKEKQLASVFRIRSIPAVLFIPKEGQPMMQTGALPRDSYVEIIDKELLKINEETK